LTGIANKTALMQRTLKNNHTVVYLDLDNFKRINDKFGHLKGDDILTKFALYINSQLRDKDIVYRVGGDEFVVVFEDVSETKIDERLNQIRGRIEQDFDFFGLSFSFGVYSLQLDTTLLGALEMADEQLYISKQKRKAKR
jgi:diguanylate cyclase (GGDEF)-like protein